MAKLNASEVIVAEIAGQDGEAPGEIHLRQPSNKEWAEFERRKFPTQRGGRGGISNDVTLARAWLFDTVCVDIVNLEDEDGSIDKGETARVPLRYKDKIIGRVFEETEDVSVKN